MKLPLTVAATVVYASRYNSTLDDVTGVNSLKLNKRASNILDLPLQDLCTSLALGACNKETHAILVESPEHIEAMKEMQDVMHELGEIKFSTPQPRKVYMAMYYALKEANELLKMDNNVVNEHNPELEMYVQKSEFLLANGEQSSSLDELIITKKKNDDSDSKVQDEDFTLDFSTKATEEENLPAPARYSTKDAAFREQAKKFAKTDASQITLPSSVWFHGCTNGYMAAQMMDSHGTWNDQKRRFLNNQALVGSGTLITTHLVTTLSGEVESSTFISGIPFAIPSKVAADERKNFRIIYLLCLAKQYKGSKWANLLNTENLKIAYNISTVVAGLSTKH
jgi:hypothetical protein